jgi:hypothetical protein
MDSAYVPGSDPASVGIRSSASFPAFRRATRRSRSDLPRVSAACRASSSPDDAERPVDLAAGFVPIAGDGPTSPEIERLNPAPRTARTPGANRGDWSGGLLAVVVIGGALALVLMSVG